VGGWETLARRGLEKGEGDAGKAKFGGDVAAFQAREFERKGVGRGASGMHFCGECGGGESGCGDPGRILGTRRTSLGGPRTRTTPRLGPTEGGRLAAWPSSGKVERLARGAAMQSAESRWARDRRRDRIVG
jgi:hypothetical protein